MGTAQATTALICAEKFNYKAQKRGKDHMMIKSVEPKFHKSNKEHFKVPGFPNLRLLDQDGPEVYRSNRRPPGMKMVTKTDHKIVKVMQKMNRITRKINQEKNLR